MANVLVIAALFILASGNPVLLRDDGSGLVSNSGNSTAVDINAELAANGPGWAATTHSDNIQGSSGQAEAAGLVLLEENGTILQLTNIAPDSVGAAQSVTVNNFAQAAEAVNAHATGESASVEYTGWSGAGGQGASTANGTLSIVVNPARRYTFF
ncbi:unnamed protein product [Orchesella dallaii]|uniref:Uncharacterized protein n=1 Tax=Orchesella dallaii TaxID=48710 RepID=A0ABP1QDL2_9HEXA